MAQAVQSFGKDSVSMRYVGGIEMDSEKINSHTECNSCSVMQKYENSITGILGHILRCGIWTWVTEIVNGC